MVSTCLGWPQQLVAVKQAVECVAQAVSVPNRLWRAYAGTELRESIQRKYGRTYDLSIVRRQLAGRTIVAMNVMVLPVAVKLP